MTIDYKNLSKEQLIKIIKKQEQKNKNRVFNKTIKASAVKQNINWEFAKNKVQKLINSKRIRFNKYGTEVKINFGDKQVLKIGRDKFTDLTKQVLVDSADFDTRALNFSKQYIEWNYIVQHPGQFSQREVQYAEDKLASLGPIISKIGMTPKQLNNFEDLISSGDYQGAEDFAKDKIIEIGSNQKKMIENILIKFKAGF